MVVSATHQLQTVYKNTSWNSEVLEPIKKDYRKALEHYNKAIQLKPSMAKTYEYRGVLFAKMGKKADAEKDLATLKKLNTKLADELEEFLKTGKEEDEYGPISPKQKS